MVPKFKKFVLMCLIKFWDIFTFPLLALWISPVICIVRAWFWWWWDSAVNNLTWMTTNLIFIFSSSDLKQTSSIWYGCNITSWAWTTIGNFCFFIATSHSRTGASFSKAISYGYAAVCRKKAGFLKIYLCNYIIRYCIDKSKKVLMQSARKNEVGLILTIFGYFRPKKCPHGQSQDKCERSLQ